MSDPQGTPRAPKSLPLILARELASNLATPMFLLDTSGMLVFYNDAAGLLLGKPFSELGEITGGEFGADLELAELDGTKLRNLESPSGIAWSQQKPAHKRVLATTYDGERGAFEATAYPLLGATGEMNGVVAVFWPDTSGERAD